jgi:hypothetical protein
MSEEGFKKMEPEAIFSVILVLPECAFFSEIDRSTIATVMQDIDDRLTEQGAPEEPKARSEIMLENALAMSHMMASREVPSDDMTYSNIAYSFLYSYGKSLGFDKMLPLRGVTGTFMRNKMLINPCLAEADYQTESAYFGRKIADHEANDDDEWDISMSFPPTMH